MPDLVHKLIRKLPHQDNELMPGVRWGNCCELFTPAFWKIEYEVNRTRFHHMRLGNNILEEIVACLLGGYGIPAEMGLLAFERLKKQKLIKHGVSVKRLQDSLSKPFKTASGSVAVYRFYNQKSKYIFELLNRRDLKKIPMTDDLALRNWLLSVNGIGYKTASWITRNWLGSDNVAILDIHIIRAGQLAGFFDMNANVSTDYCRLEQKYLRFCNGIQVKPSLFDAFIWDYMKKNNRFALRVLNS